MKGSDADQFQSHHQAHAGWEPHLLEYILQLPLLALLAVDVNLVVVGTQGDFCNKTHT